MSRAHFPHKNLNWTQMRKLLCYNTEKPELLSKKQLLTRLYKNVLRTDFDDIHRGLIITETKEYFRNKIDNHRKAFARMFEIDRYSLEFSQFIEKYEKHIDDNYDPSMLLFNNQPHSLNSNKVFIFTDEAS
jgi:hypothetical protein